MFTEEQKIRAIELYFKYGKKLDKSYSTSLCDNAHWFLRLW